ncbi:MAG: hypothetical protein NTZ17_08805 [Phycisphaerae bacterium]|nr:hypothetical protein [Phycisphaerae bacterium]
MAIEREKTIAAANPYIVIDEGAAKEFTRAVEMKIAFLREVLGHGVSGKLPGASLAEIFKGLVADGNCGNGCCY